MPEPNASFTMWRLAALILTLAFCACGTEDNQVPVKPVKARHARHKEPESAPKITEAIVYAPAAYPLHLSLAELTLEANPKSTDASAADFDIARACSQQQSIVAPQPVIILEYALKGWANHEHLVIPFTLPSESMDLSAVEEIMPHLNALPYTLYDLKLSTVKTTHIPALGDEGGNAEDASRLVQGSLMQYTKEGVPFSALDQAQIYLRLARFFISHEYKEPSYFAIENAKQSLATAETGPSGDSEVTRMLSRQIDAQESLLHKTMPFTLGF